jgi:hypothetical protein
MVVVTVMLEIIFDLLYIANNFVAPGCIDYVFGKFFILHIKGGGDDGGGIVDRWTLTSWFFNFNKQKNTVIILGKHKLTGKEVQHKGEKNQYFVEIVVFLNYNILCHLATFNIRLDLMYSIWRLDSNFAKKMIESIQIV